MREDSLEFQRLYIAGSGTDAPPKRSFTKALVGRRPAAFLPNDPSYATEGRLRPCRLGDAAFVENGALDPF